MLAEQVKAGTATLTESRKEKVSKAANATGRGRKVTENIEVIREHNNDTQQPQQDSDDNTLSEAFDPAYMNQMKVLAGVKKS